MLYTGKLFNATVMPSKYHNNCPITKAIKYTLAMCEALQTWPL